jgi:molybdate transport system regulatory protein
MIEIVHDAAPRPHGLADVRPAHRVWLQDQGLPVFGTGICELLKRVEATGSLRCAASDMGMAYSKAWQIVRRAEEHLGLKLMTRHTGGRGGGYSIVSEQGIWLVDTFSAFSREADTAVAQLFARHFGDGIRSAGERGEAAVAAAELPHTGGR